MKHLKVVGVVEEGALYLPARCPWVRVSGFVSISMYIKKAPQSPRLTQPTFKNVQIRKPLHELGALVLWCSHSYVYRPVGTHTGGCGHYHVGYPISHDLFSGTHLRLIAPESQGSCLLIPIQILIMWLASKSLFYRDSPVGSPYGIGLGR